MVSRAFPVRTCVGCRSRASASELLRVVAVRVIAAEVVTTPGDADPPGRETGAADPSAGLGRGELAYRVVPDPQHRRPGRGAYLHPDPTCLAGAQRRRAFGRALRVAGVPDTGPLVEFVTTR